MARHTSPASLGSYDLFLVFVGLMTTLAGLGIDSGMGIFISKYKEDQALLRSLFSFGFWSACGIIGLLYVFIFMCQLSVGTPSWIPEGSLLHLAFLFLLITYVNYLIFNFLRWNGLAGKAALSGFLTSAFGLIGGIVWFVLGDKEIHQYLKGLVLGSALGIPYSLFLIKGFLAFKIPSIHWKQCREMLLVSLPFVPIYVSNNLMLVADRFVINRLLGLEALGQYALLSRFAQLPNFAMNIVTKGFQPVMFLNYESTEGVRLNKVIYHSFITLLPLSVAAVGFFGKEMLFVFGGRQYISLANLLPAVVASTLLYGGMGINGMGFTIRQKTYVLVFISCMTILFNVVLNYFCIASFGFKGLAISAPAAAAIGAFIYTWKSEGLYRFGFSLWATCLSYLLTIFCSTYFSFYS